MIQNWPGTFKMCLNIQQEYIKIILKIENYRSINIKSYAYNIG